MNTLVHFCTENGDRGL